VHNYEDTLLDVEEAWTHHNGTMGIFTKRHSGMKDANKIPLFVQRFVVRICFNISDKIS
jgi:hypothetical protein